MAAIFGSWNWKIYAARSRFFFKNTRYSRYRYVSRPRLLGSLSERVSPKIKDNIAFGNPKYATNHELIYEAARLGGADTVVKRLPDGWETYLSRPDSVHDVIRIQHDDENGPIGRALRELTGTQPPQGLSGGQQQRIAV